MEDNKDSVWLGTACGLVRIAKTDLDAWVSAVDNGDPKRTIRATVFDSSDGVIERCDREYRGQDSGRGIVVLDLGWR